MAAPTQKPFTAEDEEILRDSLKRCTPATVDAAIAYRKTGAAEHAPTIIIGIVQRFLEPDIRPKLDGPCDDMRLFEDLGLDSLTMVEVVMLVEEVVEVSIDNDELRDLRTIGDVKTYIDCKLKGAPLPAKAQKFKVDELMTIMPHQPPFLFVQDASVTANESTGSYKISGSEYFLEGHFKNNPVFPASIMLEALGQLAVLHLLKADMPQFEGAVDPMQVFFTSCDGVRCQRICRPDDLLTFSVKPKRIKVPAATFEGSVTVNGEKAAFAEEITLTFQLLPAAETAESTGS